MTAAINADVSDLFKTFKPLPIKFKKTGLCTWEQEPVKQHITEYTPYILQRVYLFQNLIVESQKQIQKCKDAIENLQKQAAEDADKAAIFEQLAYQPAEVLSSSLIIQKFIQPEMDDKKKQLEAEAAAKKQIEEAHQAKVEKGLKMIEAEEQQKLLEKQFGAGFPGLYHTTGSPYHPQHRFTYPPVMERAGLEAAATHYRSQQPLMADHPYDQQRFTYPPAPEQAGLESAATHDQSQQSLAAGYPYHPQQPPMYSRYEGVESAPPAVDTQEDPFMQALKRFEKEFWNALYPSGRSLHRSAKYKNSQECLNDVMSRYTRDKQAFLYQNLPDSVRKEVTQLMVTQQGNSGMGLTFFPGLHRRPVER